MPSSAIGVSAASLHFTFGTAHPGQTFHSLDDQQFKLQFNKLRSRAGYAEPLTAASFLFTLSTLATSRTSVAAIIPASFTILTSRTDPLEPQPVVGAQGAPTAPTRELVT